MVKKLCEGRNGKKDNKGFTLVELIVVIAIMAILAVALTPKLTQYLDKAKVATDEEIINTINTAVKIALIDEKAYETVKGNVDDDNDPSTPTVGADYTAGIDILAEYNGTRPSGLKYMRDSLTSNTYTCTATTGLSEFEKQVLAAVGKEFTFKSKKATNGLNSIIIKVTSQGEFTVTCKVPDGDDTGSDPDIFYELKNN